MRKSVRAEKIELNAVVYFGVDLSEEVFYSNRETQKRNICRF